MGQAWADGLASHGAPARATRTVPSALAAELGWKCHSAAWIVRTARSDIQKNARRRIVGFTCGKVGDLQSTPMQLSCD